MGGATGAAGAGSSLGGAAVVVGGAPNAGTGGDSGGTLGLSGGTGGTAPALPSCSPITVSNAAVTLITDFSDPGTSFGNYTNSFSASIFSYPVAQDTTMGVWHVTGTVNNYAGMVFGLSCKFDVSAFTGIRFDIKGTFAHGPAMGSGGSDSGAGAGGGAGLGGSAGAGGALGSSTYGGATTPVVTLTMGTSADDVDSAHSSSSPTWGTCVPKTNQYDGTCLSPSKIIPVSADTVTRTVKWADLSGGKPQASVDPKELTSLSWILPWNGTGPVYNVDITIDNVMFTTD